MKKYRCALIDFSINNKNPYKKIVFEKYANGIKQARSFSNIPIHYSNNAKCFIGWNGNKNYMVTELK